MLQGTAPDCSLIQQQDLIGVTVVLVTCSFKDHEFLHVSNEYPTTIEVTRFNIDWTGKGTVDQPILTEGMVDENDENEEVMAIDQDKDDGDDNEEVDLEDEGVPWMCCKCNNKPKLVIPFTEKLLVVAIVRQILL